MEQVANWAEIKSLFNESLKSSYYVSIASVAENGEPHVTPIGSLILGEPGRAFYFERFPKGLPSNLANNRQVCVLAVNSSRWFWLKSLVRGKFTSPPAVRLHGIAGELRDATDNEIALWQKKVKRVSFSKGHALIWRGMSRVRDIKFASVEHVQIGQMTSDIGNSRVQAARA